MHNQSKYAHHRCAAVVQLDGAFLKLGLFVEGFPLLLEGVDEGHVTGERALLLLHNEQLQEAYECHDLCKADGAHLRFQQKQKSNGRLRRD